MADNNDPQKKTPTPIKKNGKDEQEPDVPKTQVPLGWDYILNEKDRFQKKKVRL